VLIGPGAALQKAETAIANGPVSTTSKAIQVYIQAVDEVLSPLVEIVQRHFPEMPCMRCVPDVSLTS
jgi:hypothetical protein